MFATYYCYYITEPKDIKAIRNSTIVEPPRVQHFGSDPFVALEQAENSERAYTAQAVAEYSTTLKKVGKMRDKWHA